MHTCAQAVQAHGFFLVGDSLQKPRLTLRQPTKKKALGSLYVHIQCIPVNTHKHLNLYHIHMYICMVHSRATSHLKRLLVSPRACPMVCCSPAPRRAARRDCSSSCLGIRSGCHVCHGISTSSLSCNGPQRPLKWYAWGLYNGPLRAP